MVIGKKEKRLRQDGRMVEKMLAAAELESTMTQQWNQQAELSTQNEASVPKALFIPHKNSLPFEERTVSLESEVTIGRSVYRLSATPTNAIFECRVLSRHHASLWYENGHFYIMDNQSSNGTFINGYKTPIVKDMGPQEVFSGDVVQFGIAVSELHNDDKNTYLPIVAMLKLYHANGEEATTGANANMITPLQLNDLYQLNEYVQEALERESIIESKLQTLRDRVEATKKGANSAWRALVAENALIARLNALESTRKPTETQFDDKQAYQIAAQESLQRAHEQRMALESLIERNTRDMDSLKVNNNTLKQAAERASGELKRLAGACEIRLAAAREAVVASQRRESATAQLLNTMQTNYRNEVMDVIENAKLQRCVLAGLSKMYEYEVNQKEKGDGLKDEISIPEAELTSDNLPDTSTDDEKKIRLNNDTDNCDEGSGKKDEASCSPDDNANSYHNTNNEEKVTKGEQEFINNTIKMNIRMESEIKALRERLEIIDTENKRLHAIREKLLSQPFDIIEHVNRPTVEPEPSISLSDIQEHLNEKKKLEKMVHELKTKLEKANEELSRRPTAEDYTELNETLQTLSQFTSVRERKHVAVGTDDLVIEHSNNEDIDLDEIDKLFSDATKTHDVEDSDDVSCNEPVDETTVRESLMKVMEEALMSINEFESNDALSAQPSTVTLTSPVEQSDELEVLDLLDSVIAESSFDPDSVDSQDEDNILFQDEDKILSQDIMNSTYESNLVEAVNIDVPLSKTNNIIENQTSDDSIYLKGDLSSSITLEEETDLVERLENGSVCSLREELVKAKEGWAEISLEKARLELELQRVKSESQLKIGDNFMVINYVMPIAAAMLCLFVYHYYMYVS